VTVAAGERGLDRQADVEHRVVAASPEMTELLTGPLRIESLNVVGVANQQGAAKLRSTIY
jgi:hypothetical protein